MTLLEQLQEHVRAGNIKWTLHALKRIRERHIASSVVAQAILCGEVIEDYSDAKPFPCCLVLAVVDGEPVHIVTSSDGTHAYIVTVYHPSLEEWAPDLKTRKEQS